MEITDKILEKHGLKKEEYKDIQKLLKREPNLLELGIFSAMWNEHCSYKSSRLHLKKLPLLANKLFKVLERMQELLISVITTLLYLKLKATIILLTLNLIRELRQA